MKTIFLTVFFGILFSTAQTLLPIPVYDYGMNCDNTYRDRTGEPTTYPSPAQGLEPEKTQLWFTGEYQIFFDKFPEAANPEVGINLKNFLALTIETVSFPFAPDFNDYPNTPDTRRYCVVLNPESSHHFSDNVTNDLLGYGSNLCINFWGNLPTTPYNLQTILGPNKRWEQISHNNISGDSVWTYPVYLKFSQKVQQHLGSTLGFCNGAHDNKTRGPFVNAWSVLLSRNLALNAASPGARFYDEPMVPRVVFPHSVLKHTFWYIDNNDSGLLKSFSFIVDWTRGIFRSYPFVLCGETSKQETHDISLDAWLAFDDSLPSYSCSKIGYVANFNTRFAHGGGTSNTYTYPSQDNADVVQFKLGGNARNIPTGYSGAGNTLQPYTSTPCYHTYFIDKSIDLTKINPIEKVIYNPSEVTIKNGVNLVFPSCYTFRTVRSTYPKTADSTNLNPNNANGWNSIHNGGPYQDLREIPIPTDLSPTSDPNDASVYIIENGATVVLQDGVTLYDCTFKVKPGGNILNYDSKDVAGRFKIQWLDGSDAVTQQYVVHKGRVQKEEIHLNNLIIDADVIFEAKRIYAGDITAVTLNPTGKRKVIFKAEQEANLKQIHIKPNHPHAQYELFFGNSCGKNTSVNY